MLRSSHLSVDRSDFEADEQIRAGLVSVDKALALAITALNAFPLFELMLRVKEPSRLPGGYCLS